MGREGGYRSTLKNILSCMLFIELCNAKAQEGCKQAPAQIWNLKHRCKQAVRIKCGHHPYDRANQGQQPNRTCKVAAVPEKDDRPCKVQCKLDNIGRQDNRNRSPCQGRSLIGKIGRNSHQHI